ncbi:MAG: hypothetical protein GTN89_01825 [Acidobacteria bacterium]|nr:hypothetical protein [Acidobacteriota bacterium]NIM61483.1 hypothetical protein [Acidobacteriota bacterium]NIO58115.1 hypothetical protein [Acidobacteriota bacterium]NIQ29127.1 hypothetical protein [Acidobacteriota bacterium]NIQ83678.1 hypothetical protein [Acidobacteriota bacterium]
MLLAAVYDALFAVAILFFPAPSAGLLRLELPDDLVYLRFNGVFLLMLAAMYLLAAADPRRYRGIVIVAVLGRFAGFVYLGTVWFGGGSATFLGLALADLFFSILHAVLWLRARS